MLRIDVEEYLNRNVILVTKSKWKYEGRIISLTDSTLVIDDWKSGKTKIDIFSIATINENGRK